jgi:predicted RNA-binding Zn-ribbon protein involved in translation (DUF1610 family)
MTFYRVIAEAVVSKFPGSKLIEKHDSNDSFEVVHNNEVLIVINKYAYSYFFPNTRNRDVFDWGGFIEGSPEAISSLILRDLAESGFVTLDSRGRRLWKRPVKLGNNTVCPDCGESGTIKRYFFGDQRQSIFARKLAKSRVIRGRKRLPTDAEALCVQCGWEGSTEIFRFPRKEV